MRERNGYRLATRVRSHGVLAARRSLVLATGAAVLLALALLPLGTVQAQVPGGVTPSLSSTLSYRGFTVIDSAVQARENITEIRSVMQEQLDMVLAVGLPPDILGFFQTVTIVVLPAGSFTGIFAGTSGRYTGRNGRVELVETIVRNRHRPVLLHELLHAFHIERVPDGGKNVQLLAFHQAATGLSAFNQRSHMMSNVREYFATAATTYLYGTTGQEPFSREKLQTNQPDVVRFLSNLFGPNAGQYQGRVQQ